MKPAREIIYKQKMKPLVPPKFKDKYDRDFGKGSWDKVKAERDRINKKK